jgi:hypothetical protein
VNLSLFAAEHVASTESRESEFHPTRDREVVAALLAGMAAAGHEPLPLHGAVRESAAGEGALAEHINALVPSTERLWILHELRPTAVETLRRKRAASYFGRVLAVRAGDFLADPSGHDDVDLDITNPPWSRALEWAEAALLTAQHVALHVPLATVETPERAAFFRKHPADLYPLEWRPNYDGRGTVSRAVCWIVFGPGRGGRWFPLSRNEAPCL